MVPSSGSIFTHRLLGRIITMGKTLPKYWYGREEIPLGIGRTPAKDDKEKRPN